MTAPSDLQTLQRREYIFSVYFLLSEGDGVSHAHWSLLNTCVPSNTLCTVPPRGAKRDSSIFLIDFLLSEGDGVSHAH